MATNTQSSPPANPTPTVQLKPSPVQATIGSSSPPAHLSPVMQLTPSEVQAAPPMYRAEMSPGPQYDINEVDGRTLQRGGVATHELDAR
jgi:hypothetical protein